MLGRSRGIRMGFGHRQLSLGGDDSSRLPLAGQTIETPRSVPRRLPMTPLYDGGGPFSTHVKPQGPKLLRDQLYDHMVDGEFHDVSQLDEWLPTNQWVLAMIALIAWGFAFDKRDKSFRLRKRRLGERRQFIVPLLSGVTLPKYLEVDDGISVASSVEASTVFEVDHLSSGVEIPEEERMVLDVEGRFVLSAPDFVTETIGILARKGAGKTYLANVIAEEFLGSSFEIPFVVIDPTGAWRGLRADVEGQPNTSRLVVFGGESGHYPLVADQGRQLAKVVVSTRPLPAILDLSLLCLEAQHGFVADFLGELYMLNREPLHVFIDEADAFAPQRLDKVSEHQKRCLNVVDNFVRRGRKKGLGGTLITQRAAVINKNVLSQVGAMFFLQMVAPHDLDAVETWMADQVRADVRRECRKNLPILGQGQAYYMRSGDLYTFTRFAVRQKTTFDSSATPRMGEVPRTMMVGDLSKEDRLAIEGQLGDFEGSVVEKGMATIEPDSIDREDSTPVLGYSEDEVSSNDDVV